MTRMTVGVWNALNQFGNERASAAVRTVEGMNVDVLFIGETALLGAERGEHYAEATEVMRGLDYSVSWTTDYYPGPKDRPNQAVMSMWSRIGGHISRQPLGNRYGLVWTSPNTELRVVGTHPDDKNRQLRNASAQALVAYLQNRGGAQVLMGDLNDMHPDSRRAKSMRAIGRLVQVSEEDFYEKRTSEPLSATIRREVGGRVTRLHGMSSGSSLEIYREAGYADADPHHRPTVHLGPLPVFQLDHILGKEVTFSDFTRHPRDGSDHRPITAVVEY